MKTITIKGAEYEVGFDVAVGANLRKSGAVRSLGLKGARGGFYSAYVMDDGSISKLVSVGK